jgi:hypothetical protein
MSDNGSKPRKVLNLDELFGFDKRISVDYQGKRYELNHPEALGPKELLRLDHLQDRINAMQAIENPSELTEAQAEELGDLLTEMLKIIGFSPAGKPGFLFLAKMRVMQFYLTETGLVGSEESEKKAEPQTGA